MGLFHFDRRPLLLLGAGACCGVYIATGRSCLYAILLVVALTALGLACRTSLRLIVAFFVTVAFFGLWGFVSSSALDSSYMEFDGRDCFITGRVVSVDAQKDRYTLITVKPEGIFSKKLKVYLFDNRIDFIQGDGISLTGELMKPESATNPGGYDSRKMLYGDGVTAIVFCGEGKVAFQEGVSAGHLFGLLRRDIQVRCRDFLGSENGNLVSAMLIGDKAELDPKVKDEFRDSGLSHTMAVSGSHVAYIILPLYFIFTKLGVEKKKYYPWIIVLLIFFALLAGMQPSVLRAGITAVIMLVGGLIDRNPEPLNSLAASAIILLIINPFSLYDAGFILSFTSVLSILLFYKPITYFLGNNPVSGVVSMSIAVQLGILPVMAKLFYNVQIFSVFANILVFPVRALLSVMAWLMYLLSCVYIPIGNVLSYPVGILADMMASTAELFSSSTWSVVNLVNIHPLIIAVYYVVLWLILYKKKNRMVYPAVGAIVLTLYFLFMAVQSNMWIFLDSGKADCFIIKTESGRDIMIDTGEYALGNSIAYFTGDYIDSIFLSHAHEDHIGGLSDVLERFRVGVVYIPGCRGAAMYNVISICADYGVPCIALMDGDVIEADGCRLEIFNPADYEYMSLNDTSMVIKLTCRDKSLLLCGDCESAAELDMLARGCDVKADVLKVPHHGALNAAETAFIEAVGAKTAVITCEEDDVSHPAHKTLERLAGCDIYRSDKHGAIIIELTGKGYRINTEKR